MIAQRNLWLPAARVVLLVTTVVMLAIAGATAGASPALASGPWWRVYAETNPTNLPPQGEGVIFVQLSNPSPVAIDGTTAAVTVTTALSGQLTPTEISGFTTTSARAECSVATIGCTFKGVLHPYELLTIAIRAKVEEPPGSVASLSVTPTVDGGGAPPFTKRLSVLVNAAPPTFGTSGYELTPLNADGTPATQAGSHPFELTTTLALNQIGRLPVQLPKDLNFHLPPGLLGNPTAVPQCTMANFAALVLETNLCAPNTVVGVATVTADEPKFLPIFSRTVPVFNLVPARGEPARLGFEVIGKVPIVIDTSVRAGRDYGVDASVRNATETAGLLSSQVTLWGDPGDPRHDNTRGWECVAGGFFSGQVKKSCPASSGLEEKPFLTLPSSCSDPYVEPITSSVDLDSWAAPGSFVGDSYEWMNDSGRPIGFSGCSELPFSPTVDVTPEEHSASTPSGVSIDLQVPQSSTLNPGELAEADVRNSTLSLPPGMVLSPSAANGLVGCSEEEVGFEGFAPRTGMQQFSAGEQACPEASKVGTVHIKTPLLPNELEGAIYLASPAPHGEAGKNPFGSLVALYLVANDPVSGVRVKLAGEGVLNEQTLQVTTVFRNTPQVPFEDLKVDLFGGPGASVSTPAKCGSYQAAAEFAPWSGTDPVSVTSPGEDFGITQGLGGAACPGGSLAFTPGFSALSTHPQAGAFSGFQLELTHRDGDQALSGLTMHLPQGVAAMLSSVEPCSAAQAAASACPPSSEIGHATAIAGLGSDPVVQEGGHVFITGPYGGAPFGLEIVTPAKAGPFDLGFVTVRSRLFIDPHDASVTIVSDPLPTQIRGIPLQLKRVLVTVDRPNFQFNGTSCEPMAITGTVTGDEGATTPVSNRFQLGGCEGLPFAPKLTASVVGEGSRVNGTAFTVRLESPGFGQSNIHKVLLQLPKVLPSRLETLKKACLAATFEANPASCGPEAVIGTATIHTPVLKSPLSGPAYLVSHGNAAFPDVEFVLQGEGITLVVDGQTEIKNGVTFSKFETAPDAPFTAFETVLPAGPKSVLAVYNAANTDEPYSACGLKLQMPTTMISQSNQLIETETPVATTGCSGVQSNVTKRLSLAQRYAKAIKACRTRFKHNRAKRAACERKVHSAYKAKAVAACRHRNKPHTHALKRCEAAAVRRYGLATTRRRKK